MTIISNNNSQAGIIQKLKTDNAVLAYISAEEVREQEWQGTDFVYPNIRVRVVSNTPISDSGCSSSTVKFSIMIYTEDDSSLLCNEIAGIIADELHGHAFRSNSLAFSGRINNIVPARRIDTRTWMSEVVLTAVVSPSS